MKTCPRCGRQYPDDAAVCRHDQYPLIASESVSPTEQPKASQNPYQPATGRHALYVIGFAVLAGLSGFGLTWLVIGTIGIIRSKSIEAEFLFAAKCMPVLVLGGIIGLVAGTLFALWAVKASPDTKRKIEKRFLAPESRVVIFMGAPLCALAFLMRFFESLLDKVGTELGAYLFLGIFLAVIALGLFLYDRIPARRLVPIGIVG